MSRAWITVRQDVPVDKTPDPEPIARISARQKAAQTWPPRTPDEPTESPAVKERHR